MRFSLLSLAALTLGFSSAPAFADSVLFSDLGTGSNVYLNQGWGINGGSLGLPIGVAMLFTTGGTGSESVSQIDLAVEYASVPGEFTASIWTDVSNQPGAPVAGASWNLSTSLPFGTCCSLTTVPVSGVTLVGGQQYFMVIQLLNYTSTSFLVWNQEPSGPTADAQYTQDGVTWNDYGDQAIGAFDVLGDPVPEPASILLSATGLAALFALRRRKARARKQ